jgi:hypothetical protein
VSLEGHKSTEYLRASNGRALKETGGLELGRKPHSWIATEYSVQRTGTAYSTEYRVRSTVARNQSLHGRQFGYFMTTLYILDSHGSSGRIEPCSDILVCTDGGGDEWVG